MAGMVQKKAEFGVRALGDVEMILIKMVDQYGTEESAEYLRHDEWSHESPIELSGEGEAEGDGGIKLSAGIWSGHKHSAHYGETPGDGHYYPTAALSFRLVEGYTGHYATAEQNHYECS